MQQVGALEAKDILGTLLDRVQNGEEIVIPRDGKPVARLVPASGAIDQEQVRAAMERIGSRAKDVPGAPFQWETFKADRDAGRQ